jgi:outer membrane protein assembly factor BamB
MLVVPANGVTTTKLAADGPTELWKAARLQTGMTSPLLYDGRIYAANPKTGIITCVDAATGRVLWEERVKGPFSASPVAGDGKVYVVNEAGTLFVLKAGDEGEILAKSETKDKVQATPAISHGAIFIRGETTLLCIAGK